MERHSVHGLKDSPQLRFCSSCQNPNKVVYSYRQAYSRIYMNDFSSSLVGKTSNVGCVSSVPSQGTKIPHGSWPKGQNINRSNIVPNSIKTLKMIHMKKTVLNKIYLEKHKPQNSSNTLKKRKKMRAVTLPNNETYYIATVIKIVWYCKKDRHIDH